MQIKVCFAYLFFYFLSTVNIVLSIKKVNYCQFCLDHTMCLYKTEKPSCNVISYGLSVNDQNQILNIHNKYRKKVASGNEKRGNPGPQPAAEEMPNLVWDNELATIAQRWTNQCQYEHDKCRKVSRFAVGQNIAQHRSTDSSSSELEKLISRWYDEVDIFNSREVAFVKNFKKVGHYTQMLWASTTKIGCGFLKYLKGKKKFVYLVCNYGPRGNLRNMKIYEPFVNETKSRQKKDYNDFENYESTIKKSSPFSGIESLPENLQKIVLHASQIFIPFIKRIQSLEDKKDTNAIQEILSQIFVRQRKEE